MQITTRISSNDILSAGANAPQMGEILKAATQAGIDADTLTALAIAHGVDASIASSATAAGNGNGGDKENNGKGGDKEDNGNHRGGGNRGKGKGNGGGGTSPNQ